VHAGVDGGDAAQVDLAAAARGAGVHLDQGAGDLALEGALERLGGRAVELLGGHGGHRVGEVALLDARGLTGDHTASRLNTSCSSATVTLDWSAGTGTWRLR